MYKQQRRLRRARRTRAKIKKLSVARLCVYRSLSNMYAQLISAYNANVLATASTVEKEIRDQLKYDGNIHGGNIRAASMVGKLIAERAKKVGVTKAAFDRSGYKYHGRVRALAEAARKGGLEF